MLYLDTIDYCKSNFGPEISITNAACDYNRTGTQGHIRKIVFVWQVMKVWQSVARVMDVAPPCHHLISREIVPCLSQ